MRAFAPGAGRVPSFSALLQTPLFKDSRLCASTTGDTASGTQPFEREASFLPGWIGPGKIRKLGLWLWNWDPRGPPQHSWVKHTPILRERRHNTRLPWPLRHSGVAVAVPKKRSWKMKPWQVEGRVPFGERGGIAGFITLFKGTEVPYSFLLPSWTLDLFMPLSLGVGVGWHVFETVLEIEEVSNCLLQRLIRKRKQDQELFPIVLGARKGSGLKNLIVNVASR